MSERLKPCPECGSSDTELHDDGHYYAGRCRKCEFETSRSHHRTLAAKVWNAYQREQEATANG